MKKILLSIVLLILLVGMVVPVGAQQWHPKGTEDILDGMGFFDTLQYYLTHPSGFFVHNDATCDTHPRDSGATFSSTITLDCPAYVGTERKENKGCTVELWIGNDYNNYIDRELLDPMESYTVGQDMTWQIYYCTDVNCLCGIEYSAGCGVYPSCNPNQMTRTRTCEPIHCDDWYTIDSLSYTCVDGYPECQEPECVEDWSCGSWSSCVNNIRTRTCNDLNNCGTIINKPSITEECVSGNGEEPPTGKVCCASKPSIDFTKLIFRNELASPVTLDVSLKDASICNFKLPSFLCGTSTTMDELRSQVYISNVWVEPKKVQKGTLSYVYFEIVNDLPTTSKFKVEAALYSPRHREPLGLQATLLPDESSYFKTIDQCQKSEEFVHAAEIILKPNSRQTYLLRPRAPKEGSTLANDDSNWDGAGNYLASVGLYTECLGGYFAQKSTNIEITDTPVEKHYCWRDKTCGECSGPGDNECTPKPKNGADEINTVCCNIHTLRFFGSEKYDRKSLEDCPNKYRGSDSKCEEPPPTPPPIPTDKIPAIYANYIDQVTAKTLGESICKETNECEEGSKCLKYSYLKRQGYIIDEKSFGEFLLDVLTLGFIKELAEIRDDMKGICVIEGLEGDKCTKDRDCQEEFSCIDNECKKEGIDWNKTVLGIGPLWMVLLGGFFIFIILMMMIRPRGGK